MGEGTALARAVASLVENAELCLVQLSFHHSIGKIATDRAVDDRERERSLHEQMSSEEEIRNGRLLLLWKIPASNRDRCRRVI